MCFARLVGWFGCRDLLYLILLYVDDRKMLRDCENDSFGITSEAASAIFLIERCFFAACSAPLLWLEASSKKKCQRLAMDSIYTVGVLLSLNQIACAWPKQDTTVASRSDGWGDLVFVDGSPTNRMLPWRHACMLQW